MLCSNAIFSEHFVIEKEIYQQLDSLEKLKDYRVGKIKIQLHSWQVSNTFSINLKWVLWTKKLGFKNV